MQSGIKGVPGPRQNNQQALPMPYHQLFPVAKPIIYGIHTSDDINAHTMPNSHKELQISFKINFILYLLKRSQILISPIIFLVVIKVFLL